MEIISVTKTARMRSKTFARRKSFRLENEAGRNYRKEERNVSSKDKYSLPSFNHATFCTSEVQINLNKEIILKTFNYVNMV